MKKFKLSKAMFVGCNVCIIAATLGSGIYSVANTVAAEKKAKGVYAIVSEEYKAYFGEEYERDSSYLTDIVCMKLAIANETISKTNELTKQYFATSADDGEESDLVEESDTDEEKAPLDAAALLELQEELSTMQENNLAIEYTPSTLPLATQYEAVYDSLNYLTYGANALTKDLYNFSDDESHMVLACTKDVQQIHVMANMASRDLTLAQKSAGLFKYIVPFLDFMVLLGTGVNIYRIRARKRRHRIKRRRHTAE